MLKYNNINAVNFNYAFRLQFNNLAPKQYLFECNKMTFLIFIRKDCVWNCLKIFDIVVNDEQYRSI